MYYDYHTHSSFSDDSPTPLSDMLDRAVELGIKEIAVTDHYDPGYPDPAYPFELEFDKYHNTLEEYSEVYADRLHIVKGIELGLTHDNLDKCAAAAKAYPYDYIIGSFHCALGEPLYEGHFFDEKTAKQAFCDYFTYMYENLKIYKEYCNVGHLNLVARYSDNLADFKDYGDIVEAILKMIIHDGKGIELNTSSYRYNMSCTCPSEEILRLYRELGGEIITIGSDAHTPDKLTDHFDVATEYLRSLGFRYLATFRERKPEFVKL
jgi:histidinol-phosphatase (PHP family)